MSNDTQETNKDQYEYEIKEVPTPDTPSNKESFNELIHEMARDNWRYVETIKLGERKYGYLVIFERYRCTGSDPDD